MPHNMSENMSELDKNPTPTPVNPAGTSNNPSTGSTTFQSGATRSSELKGLCYYLISPVALRRLAATCQEGSRKYSPFNCEKGFPIFGEEGLFDHAIKHLYAFAWGDTSEDHLGHALWNVCMMIHSQECWPELNQGTSRAELVPLEKRQDAVDKLNVIIKRLESGEGKQLKDVLKEMCSTSDGPPLSKQQIAKLETLYGDKLPPSPGSPKTLSELADIYDT